MKDHVEFIVSKTIVIDEDKIWDAHAADMLFGEDEVVNESKAIACSDAADVFALGVNGHLGSAHGYQKSEAKRS